MKVHIKRLIRQPRKRNQIIDVVCGMRVNPAIAMHSIQHNSGTSYYFCSAYCKAQFEATPTIFVR